MYILYLNTFYVSTDESRYDGGEIVTYATKDDSAGVFKQPRNVNQQSGQEISQKRSLEKPPQDHVQQQQRQQGSTLEYRENQQRVEYANETHSRAQSGPNSCVASTAENRPDHLRAASVPPVNHPRVHNLVTSNATAPPVNLPSASGFPKSTPPNDDESDYGSLSSATELALVEGITPHVGDAGNQSGNSAATPIASPCFFSARAAEAVQKELPVDNSAIFDVSFQSPSMRKTVDHTRSRPVARSQLENSPAAAVSPRMFENPRLNPTRRVGMPPGSGASKSLLSVKRPLHSTFTAAATGGSDQAPDALGDMSESRVNVMSSGSMATSQDEFSKRQKV